MSKRVLILSASPREGGNTDILCDEFMRGAKDAGNEVEKIFLRSCNISGCTACGFCKTHGGECSIKDDMKEILSRMMKADVIVMSSPVYFYSIASQMKAVIDRSYAVWRELKDKEFYFIMSSAEDSDYVMNSTLNCFRGFTCCLEGAKECGVIYGKGLYEAGAVNGTEYMTQAYEMGKNVAQYAHSEEGK